MNTLYENKQPVWCVSDEAIGEKSVRGKKPALPFCCHVFCQEEYHTWFNPWTTGRKVWAGGEELLCVHMCVCVCWCLIISHSQRSDVGPISCFLCFNPLWQAVCKYHWRLEQLETTVGWEGKVESWVRRWCVGCYSNRPAVYIYTNSEWQRPKWQRVKVK